MNKAVGYTIISKPDYIKLRCPHCESDMAVDFVGDNWSDGGYCDCPNCEKDRDPYSRHCVKCHNKSEYKAITNFDCCCESIENMAQAIDIMKVGWTKEQIVEWLQREVEDD